MKNELIAGGIGTTLGVVGTATQINETLQTVSLVITILGALVSFIIVPLLTWYKNAKKDGKITKEELQEATEKLEEGIEKTKETISKKEGEK